MAITAQRRQELEERRRQILSQTQAPEPTATGVQPTEVTSENAFDDFFASESNFEDKSNSNDILDIVRIQTGNEPSEEARNEANVLSADMGRQPVSPILPPAEELTRMDLASLNQLIRTLPEEQRAQLRPLQEQAAERERGRLTQEQARGEEVRERPSRAPGLGGLQKVALRTGEKAREEIRQGIAAEETLRSPEATIPEKITASVESLTAAGATLVSPFTAGLEILLEPVIEGGIELAGEQLDRIDRIQAEKISQNTGQPMEQVLAEARQNRRIALQGATEELNQKFDSLPEFAKSLLRSGGNVLDIFDVAVVSAFTKKGAQAVATEVIEQSRKVPALVEGVTEAGRQVVETGGEIVKAGVEQVQKGLERLPVLSNRFARDVPIVGKKARRAKEAKALEALEQEAKDIGFSFTKPKQAKVDLLSPDESTLAIDALNKRAAEIGKDATGTSTQQFDQAIRNIDEIIAKNLEETDALVSRPSAARVPRNKPLELIQEVLDAEKGRAKPNRKRIAALEKLIKEETEDIAKRADDFTLSETRDIKRDLDAKIPFNDVPFGQLADEQQLSKQIAKIHADSYRRSLGDALPEVGPSGRRFSDIDLETSGLIDVKKTFNKELTRVRTRSGQTLVEQAQNIFANKLGGISARGGAIFAGGVLGGPFGAIAGFVAEFAANRFAKRAGSISSRLKKLNKIADELSTAAQRRGQRLSEPDISKILQDNGIPIPQAEKNRLRGILELPERTTTRPAEQVAQ